jgi:uncharacterized membrane protein YphA (DoxX/SURF4 family)
MKVFVKIIQVFVGLLFIISGMVKANDPMGLSYKMQEFFELWNGELAAGSFFLKSALIGLFDFLHDHSLFLSVFMITLEIIAGVALILGYMKNFFLWLLLILIIFFSFLTGYAYLSGKFTNCGCFGDCLPITPLTSFGKDILLLLLIIILLAGKKYIQPILTQSKRSVVLAGSVFITLALQWYVLNYLPVADCLPLKKGNNIAQQMKPPPGSIPDSFAIRFIYEKEGKRYEFAPDQLPADFSTYTFIDRKDKLVRKGNAEPAIKNFSLTGLSGEDSTSIVLSEPKALLIFIQDLNQKIAGKHLEALFTTAKLKSIPAYVASPSIADAKMFFKDQAFDSTKFFNCDFTVVRTAARTDPTIYILQQGNIIHKFSNKQASEATKILKR